MSCFSKLQAGNPKNIASIEPMTSKDFLGCRISNINIIVAKERLFRQHFDYLKSGINIQAIL